jgi:hypothetical protein
VISDIRLFGRAWSHDLFRKRGWRGRWLLLLNAIRWRLEVRVQWHAEYLLKSQFGDDLHALYTDWRKELDPPTRVLPARDEPMHPLPAPDATTKLGSVQETQGSLARLIAGRRARRYTHGRRRYTMYDLEPATEEQDIDNAEPTTNT